MDHKFVARFRKVTGDIPSDAQTPANTTEDPIMQRANSVALKSLGGLVYDGLGGATCAVKLIQYRAPQKMTALALSGAPPASPAKLAAEATIRSLLAQVQATPWGVYLLALGLLASRWHS